MKKNLLLPSWSSYQLLGPTTLHLQHEFFLSVALTMLTVSSLRTRYGESFGTWGDFQLLFFIFLWFLRHFLLRCICTSDIATTRRPTIMGLVAYGWTSHFSAGQYYDRPNNPNVIAKHIGSSHTDDGHVMATISSFFSPTLRYAWQLWLIRVWFPISSIHFVTPSGRTYSIQSFSSMIPSPSPRLRLGINKAYSNWNDFWTLHGLSLQSIIAKVTTVMYIIYFLGKKRNKVMKMVGWNFSEEESTEFHPYGYHNRLDVPTLRHMLILLTAVGTLGSITLYGRISLPFPDLVAGSNVLKAVRGEVKSTTTQSSKPTKSRSQRENIDVPWAEQYKSIAVENKFRLICKIASIRLFEALVISAIVPWMGSTCRYTGHCLEGLSFIELSRILHPIGIIAPYRDDLLRRSGTSFGLSEFGCVMWITISIIVTTLSILLAQAITLNRSYLGTMGYIAGGWTIVEPNDPCLIGASSPSQWDPRRKYKKGDLIVEHSFRTRTIYKATSNSPEGKPLDISLRATHLLFSDELGHPSTSTVIAYCSASQVGMLLTTILLILAAICLGRGYGSLLWIVGANLIGSYGILRAVHPPYDELADLANQIKA